MRNDSLTSNECREDLGGEGEGADRVQLGYLDCPERFIFSCRHPYSPDPRQTIL